MYKLLKTLILFFLISSILQVSQAEWEHHRLPGGVALETVIVNEEDFSGTDDVFGMWIVEKHGGMVWVNWNTTSHDWDNIDNSSDLDNEYNANYLWWMGADQAVEYSSSTPTTIAATYQG